MLRSGLLLSAMILGMVSPLEKALYQEGAMALRLFPNQGQFAIYSTLRRNDNELLPLLDPDNHSSAIMTLEIDDTFFPLGESPKFDLRVNEDTSIPTYVWSSRDVVLEHGFEFVHSDAIKLKINVRNIDDEPHSIGLRYLFDIFLDEFTDSQLRIFPREIAVEEDLEMDSISESFRKVFIEIEELSTQTQIRAEREGRDELNTVAGKLSDTMNEISSFIFDEQSSGISHFELQQLSNETNFSDFLEIPAVISESHDKQLPGLTIIFTSFASRTPTNVIFANWQRLYRAVGRYTVNPTYNFEYYPFGTYDSAVSYYFAPVKVNPGQSISFDILFANTYFLQDPEIDVLLEPRPELGFNLIAFIEQLEAILEIIDAYIINDNYGIEEINSLELDVKKIAEDFFSYNEGISQ